MENRVGVFEKERVVLLENLVDRVGHVADQPHGIDVDTHFVEQFPHLFCLYDRTEGFADVGYKYCRRFCFAFECFGRILFGLIQFKAGQLRRYCRCP